jgi:hypothetical protein
MAAVAYVAILASMISRVRDHSGSLAEDGVSLQGSRQAADARFLRDVGIRP